MIGDILLFCLGLIALILGGESLLKSALGISNKLKISKIVVGLTVVAFCTSAPEMIVSVNSALSGQPGIAVGNVIGSNIVNIGLIFGLSILLMPIHVDKKFIKQDWPILVYVSTIFFLFIYFDGILNFYEGLFLFLNLVLYIIYLIKFRSKIEIEEVIEHSIKPKYHKIFFHLIFGVIGLWLGSEYLIKAAISLAGKFGVSDAVIGLTIVATGTSIPELVASIMAVIKKENSLGIGNIVGSNIFNILGVSGIVAIIEPIPIAERFLSVDVFWMLFFSLALLPLALIKKRNMFSLKEGIIILSSYVLYIYFFMF